MSSPQRVTTPGTSSGAPHRLEQAMVAMVRKIQLARPDDRLAPLVASLPEDQTPGARDAGVLGLPVVTPQPIDRLVQALSLTPTDTDLLVIALLSHRFAEVATVFRDRHPERLAWPTVGLVASLGAGTVSGMGSWEELSQALSSSRLVATGALVVDGAGPLSEQSLLLGAGVREALTGLEGWPRGLLVDPLPTPSTGLDRWYDQPVVSAAIAAIAAGTSSAFLATNSRPHAAGARLAALAQMAGVRPVVLRSAALSSEAVQLTLVLAFMRNLVPVFCDWNESDAPLELWTPFVGLPLLLARSGGDVTAYPRPLISIPVTAIPLRDRESALHAAVPGLDVMESVAPASAEPQDLALAAIDLDGQLRLMGRMTHDVARRTFLEAIDRRTSRAVPPGGVLSHPDRTWSDLVLPDDRVSLLREAVSRSRIQAEWGQLGLLPPGRRGDQGLRLMFAGPPGTGKTLAAEVMANALGRDVLRVDLSHLVSKWIGETEKNLSGVFDAAEREDVLLFFDEADVLFGRRTEIGDARDRYANLETAYLLTRIEVHPGVVVLATNLRRNIDTAFTRRVEFIVPFDPPDTAARRRLWELLTPPWARLSDEVDLGELAALYELSGALIRNAATAAAYLAASDTPARPRRDAPQVVTLAHLAHAIRREYAKAGMALPGLPEGRQEQRRVKAAATHG